MLNKNPDKTNSQWIIATEATLITFLIFLLLYATKPVNPESKNPATKQVIVARIGDREVTEEEIQRRAQGQVLRLENQIYIVKRQALDTLVADTLLDEEARKRNLTRDELLQQEIHAKVDTVSEAEAEQYYGANKQRFGDKLLEEVKPQIVQQLVFARQQQRNAAFYQELRKTTQIKIFLQPPTVKVSTDGAPARGPDDASVTIIEFSDFQ